MITAERKPIDAIRTMIAPYRDPWSFGWCYWWLMCRRREKRQACWPSALRMANKWNTGRSRSRRNLDRQL